MLDNSSASTATSRMASVRMASVLTTLGIHAGEGIAVGLLFAQSFLLGVSFFALYTAGYAIFLSHFDAIFIAYVYVLSACLLVLVGVFFTRLEQRFSFSQLLLGTMSTVLLILLFLRFGLWATSAGWIAFLLMVALRICWTIMNLVLWSLAGRLFNMRQSKRVFPLIVVGTVLAIIASSLINQPLTALIGIPNLLWISAGGLVGVIGLLYITLHRFNVQVESSAVPNQLSTIESSQNAQANSWKGILTAYRDRYILWLMVFTLLSTLATYLLDFVFIREANAYFQSPAAYANFFGTYLGATTLILLVVSLLSGAIFNRLGLKIGLQVNGAAVTLFAVLFLIGSLFFGTPGLLFGLVVLTKVADDVLVVSMTNTATRIFYQPLPPTQRVSVQTLMESIVTPVAIGLIGLFLISLQFVGELSTRQFFLIMITICLGWAFASIKAYEAYQEALRKALLKRRFTAIEPDQTAAEKEQVIRESLQSKHPTTVLYSLNLLLEGAAMQDESIEDERDNIVRDLLPELLSHDAMEVRLYVAQRLEEVEWLQQVGGASSSSPWLPLLQKHLEQEPSNQVRAALCRAWFAHIEATGVEPEVATGGAPSRVDATHMESAYIHGSDIILRNAAIVGLLRHGGIHGTLMAGPKLLELSNSPEGADRMSAAHLVGQVGDAKFYQPLVTLVADANVRVRNAAIQAAGNVQNPVLWPFLVQALAEQSTKRSAASSLIQVGEAVLPILSYSFDSPEQSDHTRTEIAQIVGQIGGSEAGRLLWEWSGNRSRSKPTRQAIWRGLRRSDYRATIEQERQVIAHIEYELEQVSWLSRAWNRVNNSSTNRATDDVGESISKRNQGGLLLDHALVNELEQVRSNLFDLLTFICDRPLLMQVRRILEEHFRYQAGDGAYQSLASNSEKLAYAQEALDDLLPAEIHAPLLPFLTERLCNQSVKRIQERYPTKSLEYTEWLLELIGASESKLIPWTQACAIYAAGELDHTIQMDIGLREILEVEQQNEAQIIQETATTLLNSARIPLGE